MHEHDMWITAADGVRLAVTLIVPDECDLATTTSRSFAPLVEALPYRKDDLTASYRTEYRRLADEGRFVIARVDLRGTGSSEGIATDEYPLTERSDIATVIAWLAEQPWSNGNVGMYGTSYSGFNSLQLACERPPALKAIVPIYATDDRYTDDVHYCGGVRRAIDMVDYVAYMINMNALPPVPAVFGDGWLDEWQRRLDGTPPWVLQWMRQQNDGEYWRNGSLRPDYQRITAATLHVGGWADGYRNAPLRSTAAMTAPSAILFGPWAHASTESSLPGPHIDLVPELIEWFDRWLRRDDPHVDPIVHRIFMRRATPPRADLAEHNGEWWAMPSPIATTPALRRSSDASCRPASTNPSVADDGWATLDVRPDTGTTAWISCAGHLPYGQPTDQRADDAHSIGLDWMVDDECAVLGNPVVSMQVRVDQPVAMVVVKLCDVHPDGTSQLVSRGILNLTHRQSSTSPTPVTPGEPIRVDLQLEAASWIFEPGHKMRMSISGSDWPNVWPTPYAVRLGVDVSSVELDLPTVTRSAAPPPSFASPTGVDPHRPDTPHNNPPVVWRIEHDVVERVTRAIVSHGSSYTGMHNSAITETYAGEVGVPLDRPAAAWSEGRDCFDIEWPGHRVRSAVVLRMDSDHEAYHLSIDLRVEHNDVVRHEQSWRESIPRLLQ